MTVQITGETRNDALLRLDDDSLQLRDKAITETLRLYRAAFDPRIDMAAASQFDNPQPGDLVLELTRSSWARDPRTRAIGFGYLLAREGETWWVQYGPDPDDVCEWANCMFIRVPRSVLAPD